MTTEPVGRLVTSLAIPSMGSMVVTALYNIADTWFVSRTGTQSAAALGIVFTYMSLVQAVSFFFGQGSGNFISRALGSQHTEDAGKIAATGFFSAMIFMVTTSCLAMIFMNPILSLLGSTDTILPYARSYFRWILVGAPFISCTFVLNNQMRHQGNAMMAMVGILSGAVINVILDPVLIFALGMGVEGAGLATCISQAIAFCIMLRMCRKRGGIAPKLRNFKPTLSQYRQISKGGIPSLGRQGAMALTAMVLNNIAGLYGDVAIAAFAIVNRIMMLVQSLMIGFGQGFQPVCGFNFGARLYDRVRQGFRFCAGVTTTYALVFSVLGLVFAPQIVSLFKTGDEEVVLLGIRILRAQCITFTLAGFIITTNMYLQNIGATWSAFTVAIARQGLYLIPALWILNLTMGLSGVIIAQPVSDVCSMLTSLPLASTKLKRMG